MMETGDIGDAEGELADDRQIVEGCLQHIIEYEHSRWQCFEHLFIVKDISQSLSLK